MVGSSVRWDEFKHVAVIREHLHVFFVWRGSFLCAGHLHCCNPSFHSRLVPCMNCDKPCFFFHFFVGGVHSIWPMNDFIANLYYIMVLAHYSALRIPT